MNALRWVIVTLYSVLLAHSIWSEWDSGSFGWIVAATWFAIYVFSDAMNDWQLKRLMKRHVKDMGEIAETAMKGTGELVKFINEAHSKASAKERAHFEKVEAGHQRRIHDLQEVIKIYARNEEERKK